MHVLDDVSVWGLKQLGFLQLVRGGDGGAHYRREDVGIKQFRHYARVWGDWIPALLKAC